MNEFEKAEEIRQWLVDTVGEDLRASGIAEETADLELQALACGVSFYLIQMKREQQELPDEQMQCIRRLDLFQLLSEINLSPEYAPRPAAPVGRRPPRGKPPVATGFGRLAASAAASRPAR
jgi:hypothetical protein